MLGWRGASWCARIAAILQRGIDSQALLRFSQVRVSTGRLVLRLNSLEEQALRTCPREFELALGEAVTAIQLGNYDLVLVQRDDGRDFVARARARVTGACEAYRAERFEEARQAV
jgi:hypothetical protein